MPKYKYVAKDALGKRIKGSMNASSEAALYELLRSEQKYLISCKVEENEKKNRYRLKPMQLSEFCRQLGTMLSAGVSLVRAMQIIQSESTLSRGQREIYVDLIRRIRRGDAFSDAMEAQQKAFPPLLVHMFRAAEESGNLSQTALRMAEHYRKEYRLKTKLKSATMYPKILGVTVLLVTLVIFCFIMPQFSAIFKDMELPLLTRVLLSASRFVVANWQWLLLGFLLAVVLGMSLLSAPGIRLFADKSKIHMPVIGHLFQIVYTADFARTLCSLYTSGLPIVAALQVGKETLGNRYLESQLEHVISLMRKGEALSTALDQVDGFHKKLASCVAVGEETGSLDTMLISTADNFDYDAENAMSKLIGYLGPVMIIIMGIVVGMIMIAVMMPLMNIYSEIEKSGGI